MSAAPAWSAERCAKLLPKAKRTPTGWKACCPGAGHDDKNPSLFLADGQDGIALVCYAGCNYRDIASALEAKGAILREAQEDRLNPPSEHYQLGPYTSHWDYRDASGHIVMRVCRWERPGGKELRPLVRTADGWKWQHHPAPRPLYQLDRLVNEPELSVVLVEGEKAAAAAQRLYPNHIVTTWSGGAASVGQADFGPLKGRDVVLVPDCDDPGRKAMSSCQQRLQGHAKSVRIVDPGLVITGLPEKWDLADALAEGRDVSGWLEAPQVEQPTGPELFGLLWYAALQTVTQPEQLVKGLLLAGCLAVIYGESNTGKTFLILDLALAIARGITWRGRRTRRGLVIYIAGEGAASVRARVAAYHVANPGLGGLPFAIINLGVDFRSIESVERLRATVRAAEAEAGEIAALIVVDTLARAMPGGDENSTEDMGTVVAFADQLRMDTGACVVFVHHSGKDASKGARGSSALRAAVDTELLVEGLTGARTITATKQRDLECGEPMPFELVPVSIGEDPDDGNPVTSCTVRHIEASAVAAPVAIQLRGKAQRQLLSALRTRSKDEPSRVWTLFDLRHICKELGMSKSSGRYAVDALVATPYMQSSIGGYLFTDGEVGK